MSVYAYDCLMYFDWPNCHCLNYPDKGTGSLNLRKNLNPKMKLRSSDSTDIPYAQHNGQQLYLLDNSKWSFQVVGVFQNAN